MKNREGYYVTESVRECTNCGSLFPNVSKMTLCKSCNSTRVKSMSPEWKMHQRAKIRAKEMGRSFDISVSDIVIPSVCPVLGIPLEIHSGSSGGKPYSPSLDRIENSKGYTKDNIQVISHKANQMKIDATKEELISFAKWILKTFDTE